MMIIGLTGGIGSGKTTVANAFAVLGVPIVDTDEISHSISRPGQPGSEAVLAAFGTAYIDPQGAIDRQALRQLVFADPASRRRLEQLMHPLIRSTAIKQINGLPANTPYAILVVPLLFETGSYSELISRSISVDCPEALQIQRVMQRSGLSEAMARSIMSSQLNRESRNTQADDIIDNTGTELELTQRVEQLHSVYLQLANTRHHGSRL
jgi:dephospho-CoA kinase